MTRYTDKASVDVIGCDLEDLKMGRMFTNLADDGLKAEVAGHLIALDRIANSLMIDTSQLLPLKWRG